uniref:Uncharacterized protein n=1 Tax=Ascaris lumbricoides TaxID=6252 RepID=A0A9J2PL68_ASCLU
MAVKFSATINNQQWLGIFIRVQSNACLGKVIQEEAASVQLAEDFMRRYSYLHACVLIILNFQSAQLQISVRAASQSLLQPERYKVSVAVWKKRVPLWVPLNQQMIREGACHVLVQIRFTLAPCLNICKCVCVCPVASTYESLRMELKSLIGVMCTTGCAIFSH